MQSKNFSGSEIQVSNLNVKYDSMVVLKNINLDISHVPIIGLIGRSGCGKSTFLRCINRMNDMVDNCHVSGSVKINDMDIYGDIDVTQLRKYIGMVFQAPNPFPKTIFENVSYGIKIHNITHNKTEIKDRVETGLKQVGLWDDVQHKLHENALGLSGGQQQRLCIARTLAIEPNIILMDEPCSALDPIATMKIEDLIRRLSENITIIIVTHSMQQAARISQHIVFFDYGEIIEHSPTDDFFTNPKDKRSLAYITGTKKQ